MSRMSTLLYLERSPGDLRALEIEIEKTLRPFLTESGWKRKSMRFDFGWMFDWLDFPSADTSKFVTYEGPSGIYVSTRDTNAFTSDGRVEWEGFTKEQKRLVHIDSVLEICQFENYLDTADLTVETLNAIVEGGYILFPDGSKYEDGEFTFAVEPGLPGSVAREVSQNLVEIASTEAVKKLLKRAGASLILCTFHTRL